MEQLRKKGTEPSESDWEELDHSSQISLNGKVSAKVSIVPDTEAGRRFYLRQTSSEILAHDGQSGSIGIYTGAGNDVHAYMTWQSHLPDSGRMNLWGRIHDASVEDADCKQKRVP